MSSADVRPPAIAGSFYPGDAAALRTMVGEFLDQAPLHTVQPKAIVSPHAGYIYSGAIAATALKPLLGRANTIERVVLLGPPHRMPVRRFCVPSVRAFATPLGEIPLDPELMAVLRAHPGVVVDDAPHAQEHCLETQLPFLQQVLGSFKLAPVLVGDASPDEVTALLAKVWGGDETLVLVSSDLSHYNDYARTQTLDEAARRAIETLRGDQLGEEQACGRHGLRGLLTRAAELDLRATTLDLRNSGDTAGHAHRDRVVGYGGWSFEYSARARLSDSDRDQLTKVARQAISLGLRHGRPAKVDTRTFSRPLQAIRASFITLTLDGRLRGCIGSVVPHEPLVADVAANAYKAAFQDPRFPRLSQDEVSRLEVSISILSHPRSLQASSEAQVLESLNPEVDGLILEARDPQGQPRRGLFLPHVWHELPDPRQFLRHLKAKAGLPAEGWPPGARVWRYRTETFH
jgi:AmmeMemoRadiSam system protein B/AmmeMemoRadiSam system protein A